MIWALLSVGSLITELFCLSASSFDTTQWTVVLRSADQESEGGRASLEQLCRSYWQPVYAWVRSTGRSHEDAQDLTQAFFQHVISKELHADVHPSRGRFRNWLVTLLKHFLLNQIRRDQTLKRGGPKRQSIPIEEAFEQSAAGDGPDRAYERKWAHAVLANALERLREEFIQSGQEARFELLHGLLFDATRGEGVTEAQAVEIGLTANAAKVALTRMRKRYREMLRVEVARLVEDPAEVDDELAHLMQVLRG